MEDEREDVSGPVTDRTTPTPMADRSGTAHDARATDRPTRITAGERELREWAKDALFELIYLVEVVDEIRGDDTTKGAKKTIHNLSRTLSADGPSTALPDTPGRVARIVDALYREFGVEDDWSMWRDAEPDEVVGFVLDEDRRLNPAAPSARTSAFGSTPGDGVGGNLIHTSDDNPRADA